MRKRSYGQYCALARAFEVVGERWTPLLLRELAMGPRRFADLQEGLAGVGSSLRAERLKALEAEAIAAGKVTVEGDEGARIRSLQILAPAALGAAVNA